MNAMNSLAASSMLQALRAEQPAADRAAQMMLYGQFLGSWDGRLAYRDSEGVRRETTAEVHFDWALEGRAVQDVWIAPARGTAGPQLMYGTTVRVFDPRADLWHITWIDPVRQVYNSMTGRAVGRDIVQEYRTADGLRVQWMFTEITPDSFHWSAREAQGDSEDWRVRGEFFLQRREAAP